MGDGEVQQGLGRLLDAVTDVTLRGMLAGKQGEREDRMTRVYRRVMGAILRTPVYRWGFLGGVVLLLLGSVSLFYIQFVKVKMLPFDNKSEFQVIVDMPEGTSLEKTAAVTRELAAELSASFDQMFRRADFHHRRIFRLRRFASQRR